MQRVVVVTLHDRGGEELKSYFIHIALVVSQQKSKNNNKLKSEFSDIGLPHVSTNIDV